MPVFRINSGDCIIKANNEEEAKIAFANYVGGDLGIECFNSKELKDGEYDEVDYEA